jgi:hypothetical protein
MRKDPRQFGSFCGLDNRRTVAELFVRMGEGERANQERCRVLQRLITLSDNGFAKMLVRLESTPTKPMDPVAAYNAFVAITGVLGVDIDVAAKELEDYVRGRETPILGKLVLG